MKYSPYPAYRDSGVEWLGEVPEKWEIKAIKWESHVQRGASPRPIDNPVYFDDDGEYAWVRISDVTSAGMYLEATEQKLSELGSSLSVKMQPGSLFLSIAGTVGKPCIANIKCCIHDGFVYFPRWKGDTRFLYYIFASGEPYKGLGKMGTQLNLNTDTVGGIVVGLPNQTEQTTIADFLDRETGRIDTLVAKKREMIRLLKEKRTALISSTVTCGLTADVASELGLKPHTHSKDSGIEWLGEIPEGWQALPIRRVVQTVKTGGTPSGVEDYHFEEDGFKWYSPTDFSDDIYLGESNRTLSELGKKEVRLFSPMTVMMVGIGATIGKIGLATEESSCNQQINGIVCDKKLNPVFATYYLKTMRDFIVKCGKFTTLPIINQDETKNLIITVPPLDEQIAIANYLDRETAKLDKLVEKVEAAIARLPEYRTALITAAVTGKIDLRELTA